MHALTSIQDMQQKGKNIGQSIMMESFSIIGKEVQEPDIPLWKMWPMLHVIHTTADFEMEKLLWMDEEATAILWTAR